MAVVFPVEIPGNDAQGRAADSEAAGCTARCDRKVDGAGFSHRAAYSCKGYNIGSCCRGCAGAESRWELANGGADKRYGGWIDATGWRTDSIVWTGCDGTRQIHRAGESVGFDRKDVRVKWGAGGSGLCRERPGRTLNAGKIMETMVLPVLVA